MFLDILSCFQLGYNFLRMPSIDHRYSTDILRCVQDVLRCSQMFSNDYKCFWIFSRYSIDVLLMFSRCSLDVLRMFAGCFQDVPMGLVGLVEFDDNFK